MNNDIIYMNDSENDFDIVDSTNDIPNNETINEILEQNYIDAFKEYDLSKKEASKMLEVMDRYKKNIKCNYYELLPKQFKEITDGMYRACITQGFKSNHNSVAKELLAELVNDAEINKAYDDYSNAMQETILSMSSEYNKLILEAFNEVFNNIKNIEEKDPEKAEKIKRIKNAFDKAITFEKQIKYIEAISTNKLNKFAKRYNSEVEYFNKVVNSTDIKIPNINDLLDIIYLRFTDDENNSKYDKITIKKFIISICKTTAYGDLNFNDNIEDMAYLYRMINSIHIYKFLDKSINNDDEELLFGNISKVLDLIVSKS